MIVAKARIGSLFESLLRAREAAITGKARIRGRWQALCFGPDGRLKFRELFENIVVNEGLDDLLDVTLSGATQDTTWFVGLKGSGTPAAGDTLASHATWSELSSYTGSRQAWVDGGVSGQSVSNSASPASFSITGPMTVAGAFLAGVDSGSAGALYAAGDFAASRSVDNGDTLEVTATFTTADDGV